MGARMGARVATGVHLVSTGGAAALFLFPCYDAAKMGFHVGLGRQDKALNDGVSTIIGTVTAGVSCALEASAEAAKAAAQEASKQATEGAAKQATENAVKEATGETLKHESLTIVQQSGGQLTSQTGKEAVAVVEVAGHSLAEAAKSEIEMAEVGVAQHVRAEVGREKVRGRCPRFVGILALSWFGLHRLTSTSQAAVLDSAKGDDSTSKAAVLDSAKGDRHPCFFVY